jgi:hypothetical protein
VSCHRQPAFAKRFYGHGSATLDPAELAISNLRTWIAERWDVTVKSTDAAWDDTQGKRVNNREALAWYDVEAVYIPTKRLHEAAGKVLTEREIAQALDQRGLLARRPNTRRIAVRRIPGIGCIDAYALCSEQFGRKGANAEPDLEVHQGGRS